MKTIKNITVYKTPELAELQDNIVVETPFFVIVKDHGTYTILCAPEDLEAMALGFLFSERLIYSRSDIKRLQFLSKDTVEIDLIRESEFKRSAFITSSHGMHNSNDIEALLAQVGDIGNRFKIPVAALPDVMQKMRKKQDIFRETGGTHAVAVFNSKGDIVEMAEDVGRHNALDKAIGKMLLDDRDLEQGGYAMAFSGRVSFEMVLKAAKAGAEMISAVSAPTSMAVSTAESLGITLCGFVRSGATVYTHPHRVMS